jgi:hypothetical protein
MHGMVLQVKPISQSIKRWISKSILFFLWWLLMLLLISQEEGDARLDATRADKQTETRDQLRAMEANGKEEGSA